MARPPPRPRQITDINSNMLCVLAFLGQAAGWSRQTCQGTLCCSSMVRSGGRALSLYSHIAVDASSCASRFTAGHGKKAPAKGVSAVVTVHLCTIMFFSMSSSSTVSATALVGPRARQPKAVTHDEWPHSLTAQRPSQSSGLCKKSDMPSRRTL